jgi:hypothetical protein
VDRKLEKITRTSLAKDIGRSCDWVGGAIAVLGSGVTICDGVETITKDAEEKIRSASAKDRMIQRKRGRRKKNQSNPSKDDYLE